MNMLRIVAIWLTLGAAVFPGMWAPPSWGEQAGMNLNPADKQLLLQVARDTIAAQLQGKAATPVKVSSPVLEEFRGAFVSLHRRGPLRGCIGYTEAVKPLPEPLVEMAPAAAFQDPRFR